MDKIYIDANTLIRDTWHLAAKVVKSGWRPDLILALWRGGALPGVALHEFLEFTGWDCDHLPLKCASYTGIGEAQEQVEFVLGDAVFQRIKRGAKILVVDDVLDSGRTAFAVRNKILSLGAQMRIACPYVKSAMHKFDCRADYFVKDFIDRWIVFPHEICGLSANEVGEKDGVLMRALSECKKFT